MIKMEYLINDDQETPEGTKVVTCEKCHRKFAVPVEASLMAGTICEECAPAADKEAAAQTAIDLKNDQTTELKAALGE